MKMLLLVFELWSPDTSIQAIARGPNTSSEPLFILMPISSGTSKRRITTLLISLA
ncbi:MAG: hypothetical protein QM723_30815 [Myxococcaceae bacterium]